MRCERMRHEKARNEPISVKIKFMTPSPASWIGFDLIRPDETRFEGMWHDQIRIDPTIIDSISLKINFMTPTPVNLDWI